MPIIRERENVLKQEILNLLQIPLKAFPSLITSIKKNDIEILKEINYLNDLIIDIYHNGIELAISNFALAPLGKDLRRNIAYLQIAKDIKSIMENAESITGFLNNISKTKKLGDYNLGWIVELSNKIIRRLKLVEELIKTEDVVLADKIIAKDESINRFYRNLVSKYINAKNIKTPKDKLLFEANIAGFILSSKNFEIAGDTIKDIAKIIKFIIAGKF